MKVHFVRAFVFKKLADQIQTMPVGRLSPYPPTIVEKPRSRRPSFELISGDGPPLFDNDARHYSVHNNGHQHHGHHHHHHGGSHHGSQHGGSHSRLDDFDSRYDCGRRTPLYSVAGGSRRRGGFAKSSTAGKVILLAFNFLFWVSSYTVLITT